MAGACKMGAINDVGNATPAPRIERCRLFLIKVNLATIARRRQMYFYIRAENAARDCYPQAFCFGRRMAVRWKRPGFRWSGAPAVETDYNQMSRDGFAPTHAMAHGAISQPALHARPSVNYYDLKEFHASYFAPGLPLDIEFGEPVQEVPETCRTIVKESANR